MNDPDPALLDAVVRRAATTGWTGETLRAALSDIGEPPEMAPNAFPRGVIGVIEAWCRLADSRMEAAAAAEDFAGLRTPERIRRVVELRLSAVAEDREALRRAAAILALPWNLAVALRCTARTVSAMWYAAGDRSADFSWYTRRATLAAVYGATLAFWLGPRAPDMAEVLAFLDRRLADIAPRRAAAA